MNLRMNLEKESGQAFGVMVVTAVVSVGLAAAMPGRVDTEVVNYLSVSIGLLLISLSSLAICMLLTDVREERIARGLWGAVIYACCVVFIFAFLVLQYLELTLS